ncbi:hypothetical protein [Minwuia thermotolerans]|uniref:hypothetical protein n=1 Tax=Minwuia thermotolerans TaxID=2056226 RepID=UPI000D6DC36C|nr:hypothetical protein [Minwuia thermotolerans]
MANTLKIFLIVIALAGIAAIAYFLYAEDAAEMVGMDAGTRAVSVERDEPSAAADDSADQTSMAAEEKPAAASAEAPAPVTDATGGVQDLAALSAEELELRYEGLEEDARRLFVDDYVAAVGEEKAIEFSREFRSGPVAERNRALSFDLARAAVEKFDSRIGAFVAGTELYNGVGVERDLAAALAYFERPSLEGSDNADYWRALILADQGYADGDKEAAVAILNRIIESPDSNDSLKEQSRDLLAEIEAR